MTTGNRKRRQAFVADLLSEIALYRGYPGVFDTVYLGGGTPSFLEADHLGRVLEALQGSFTLAPDRHLFLEANPEDVDPPRLEAWRGLGVETLSLGIQSFHEPSLRFLGRRHDPAQARRSVELALEAGFATVSVDLIYGLPASVGVSRSEWLRDLDQAVELCPHHLSCYELTFHRATPFGRRLERGELQELGDTEQAELFVLTHTHLKEAGYEGYEVSNFARTVDDRSRHNQKYWHHTPYLGLGPSAHSFRDGSRWWNEADLGAYQARLAKGERPVAGGEKLSDLDLALEALMMGLRTSEGVDPHRFEARFGISLLEENSALVLQLRGEGLLEPHGPRLVPTLRGLAVVDSLAASFELDRGRRGAT